MAEDPGSPIAEAPEERETLGSPAGRLLVQFFLIPALVVGVAVFVFWFFAYVAADRKSPTELLDDVRTGSRNQRWQSAFELTRRLPALTDPVARAAFVDATVKAYEGAKNDDPRVRRYLTLVLGRLGDPRAVPLLTSALAENDPETRLYALWALAMIGDPASAAAVRPLLQSDDAGVRKTAAFAAGRMEDGEAVPALRALLQDSTVDVRWNAALALAQLDDPAGRDVLFAMTRRSELAKVPGLTPEQQDEAVLNGLRGLVLLKDERAKALADELTAKDPSFRVRREAGETVKPAAAKKS